MLFGKEDKGSEQFLERHSCVAHQGILTYIDSSRVKAAKSYKTHTSCNTRFILTMN